MHQQFQVSNVGQYYEGRLKYCTYAGFIGLVGVIVCFIVRIINSALNDTWIGLSGINTKIDYSAVITFFVAFLTVALISHIQHSGKLKEAHSKWASIHPKVGKAIKLNVIATYSILVILVGLIATSQCGNCQEYRNICNISFVIAFFITLRVHYFIHQTMPSWHIT